MLHNLLTSGLAHFPLDSIIRQTSGFSLNCMWSHKGKVAATPTKYFLINYETAVKAVEYPNIFQDPKTSITSDHTLTVNSPYPNKEKFLSISHFQSPVLELIIFHITWSRNEGRNFQTVRNRILVLTIYLCTYLFTYFDLKGCKFEDNFVKTLGNSTSGC